MVGREMIWVTRGPVAGRFMEADADEAEQAEADGWAQRTMNRDHMDMVKAEPGPHEKAEEWLARQPGYTNRELRPAPAPAPAPPKAKIDDEAAKKPSPPKKK